MRNSSIIVSPIFLYQSLFLTFSLFRCRFYLYSVISFSISPFFFSLLIRHFVSDFLHPSISLFIHLSRFLFSSPYFIFSLFCYFCFCFLYCPCLCTFLSFSLPKSPFPVLLFLFPFSISLFGFQSPYLSFFLLLYPFHWIYLSLSLSLFFLYKLYKIYM